MDKIEKLEMELEVLRNVVKNMAKKLGIDPEFDKMKFIPEKDLIEKEPVEKNLREFFRYLFYYTIKDLSCLFRKFRIEK